MVLMREGEILETMPAVTNEKNVTRVYTNRPTILNAARFVPENSHTQSLGVKYSTKSPHSMVLLDVIISLSSGCAEGMSKGL